MKKFTFVTFIKIFGICLGSLLGVLGITLGVMKLTGAMDEPSIYPTQIAFEYETYDVDSDFTAKITSTTLDITKKDITLTFVTTEQIKETDGYITDGVITIPKSVKIDEEFTIKLNKTINDGECDGNNWIAGGHSEIRATSVDNPKCNSAKTKVNVDVPVYKIELETRLSADEQDNNTFVLNSNIQASLKFYPVRSAYQFSQDGKSGTQVVCKNAYFDVQSKNDECIEQQGTSNIFTAKKLTGANPSIIVGYCFKTTVIENKALEDLANLSESTKRSEIMKKLDESLTADTEGVIKSFKTTKSVNIVDINVDKITVSGSVKNATYDTRVRIYANKTQSLTSINSDLGIKLSSNYDKTISLQNKLTNIGIRFLIQKDNEYVDCVSNEDATNNIIFMGNSTDDRFYSSKVTYDNKTYFAPVQTTLLDDYYWDFVVTRTYSDTIYVEIAYIEDGVSIEPVKLSFKAESVIDEPISWNTNEKDVTIKILDDEDENNIQYLSFDLKDKISIPQNNTYKQDKYFVYTDDNKDLENLIVCKSAVEYTLGTQTLRLYELSDGIVKAKSRDAHNIVLHCVFVTVETDYLGNIKLDGDNKYIIRQYSTLSGILDTIDVTIQKTIQAFESYMEFNSIKEDLIYNKTEDEQKSFFAFVQSISDPVNMFNVCIKNAVDDETEASILKNALQNGEISLVVKFDGEEQIVTSSATQATLSFKTLTRLDGDKIVTQKYSAYIGQLANNIDDPVVTLFIRYQKTPEIYQDYEITYKITQINNNPVEADENFTADYLEIYSGKAVKFKFNINDIELNNGQIKTSKEKPIVIKPKITATGNYVGNVATSYTYDGNDITLEDLFEMENDLPKKLKIKREDKYGKLPIYSDYTLEEDPDDVDKILAVSQDIFSFTKQGEAVLLLKTTINNQTQVQDKLYLKNEGSGSISELDILKQEIVSNQANYTYESYTNDDDITSVLKTIKTIDIVGAKDETLYFNNTESKSNLIQYKYKFTDDEGQNQEALLTNKTKFYIVEGWDSTLYSDYIRVNNSDTITDITSSTEITGLYIKRDFGGQDVKLKFLVTVPDLNISQFVYLNIKPNIKISMSKQSENLETKSYNSNQYVGFYSEKEYSFDVNISYLIKSTFDQSSYYAFNFKLDGKDSIEVKKDTTGAKLKEDLVYDNSTTSLYTTKGTITFNSFEANPTYSVLTFGTKEPKPCDPQVDLYIYFVPNVSISLASDTLYLSTIGREQGEVDLLDSINVSGLSQLATDLNTVKNKITFEIQKDSQKSDYTISNTTLVRKTQLNKIEEVKIIVKYNNCPITVLSPKISPNIRENSGADWVTFTMKNTTSSGRYLKLVNGKSYSQDNLKAMFLSDNDQVTTIKSIVINATDSDYITQEGETYTIRSVTNLENATTLTVTLANENSLTFNVLLFPSDLPFVSYENGDNNVDLANLLDENWLIDNDYYTAIYSGEKVAIDNLLGGEDNEEKYGIVIKDEQNITNITYSVQNSDYVGINTDKKTLKVLPTAVDQYVIVYAIVTFNDSLTSFTIPYRVKIQKELSQKIFYPYTTQGNTEQVSQEKLLSSSADFVREYLTVGSNNKVEIDLLATQESIIPNKSQNLQRFALLKKNIDGTYEEYKGNYDYTFEVTRVYYTEVEGELTSFREAGDISSFAKIINTSTLSLNTKGLAKKMRIEIKVSTLGTSCYYYVSTGEIPNFELYKTDNTSTDISVDIKAGSSRELNYKLNKVTTTNTTPPTTSTTDASDLLCYFSPKNAPNDPSDKQYLEITIDGDGNTSIETQSCTNNWSTTLVIYTKYGTLKLVSVVVTSNYEVKQKEQEIFDNNTITSDDFNATKDSADINIQGVEITEVKSTNNENLEKYLTWSGNQIAIGAVDTTIAIEVAIKFDLGKDEDNTDVIYTGTYTFTIKPSLELNTVDGQVISERNKLVLNPEVNGGESSVQVTLYSQATGTEKMLFVQNIATFTQNNSQFKATLISDVKLKDKYRYSIDNGILKITCPRVAEDTVIVYKVEYYNEFESEQITVLTAYITFQLNPNFVVSSNYPSPVSEGGNDYQDIRISEYFYTGDTNSLKFSLNSASLLGGDNRVVIKDITTEEKLSDFNGYYVKLKSTYGNVIVDETPNGAGYYNFDQEFTFKFNNGTSDDVTFTIYLKIYDEYFAVGSYNVNITQNIGDVWSLVSTNFNNIENSADNSKNNPEYCYIGFDSEITRNIEVEIGVDTTTLTGLDSSKTYSYKITKIFGVSVEQLTNSTLPKSISSQIVLLQLNASPKDVSDEITFEIYDDAGNKVGETLSNTETKTFTIKQVKSRIALLYKGIECDVYKLYNAIDNLYNLSFENGENIQEGKITLGNGAISLGSYYKQDILDVTFDNTTFEVITGEKTHLLNKSETSIDFSAGMRRRSSLAYYTAGDISEKDISISLADENSIQEYSSEDNYKNGKYNKTNVGYLRVTPVQSGESIVDFIILAMGAPNQSVIVTVTFQIDIGGNKQDYTLVFTVSNDYGDSLSLLNVNGTQNSETNQCVLQFGTIQMALLNSQSPQDNYLYIEHTGKVIEEAFEGNIIPLFKLTLNSDGFDTNYISRLTSSTDTLTLCFEKVTFGNKHYCLEFTDDYGYTFNYYITLQAYYDVTVKSSGISAFESDTVMLVDASQVEQTTNVKIPMTVTTSTTTSFDMTKIQILESSTFTYKYAGESKTIGFTTDKKSTKAFVISTNRSFIIPSLSELGEELQIQGTLRLELMYDGSTDKQIITINFIIKPEYTIKTINDDVYVRDGVSFDMWDIVEVISNRDSSVKVGDRSLEKAESIKVDYSVQTQNGISNDGDISVLGTWMIKARHKTSGSEQIQSLGSIELNATPIYQGIQDLFGITDTSKYTFQLLFLHNLGGDPYEPKTTESKDIYIQSDGLFDGEKLISNDISIKFYEYKLGERSEYLPNLGTTFNPQNSEDEYDQKSEVATLTIKAQSSQIIQDQLLKIGINKKPKNGKITVVFTNNTSLTIDTLDVNTQTKTISLVDKGIIQSGSYTELFTGKIGDTYYNRGLSQADIQALKDFNFVSINGQLTTKEGTLKNGGFQLSLKELTGNDENDLQWKSATIDGTTFVYQQQTLNLELEYCNNGTYDNDGKLNYSKTGVNFDVPIKVTLKYIAVDKRQAYGTNAVKFVTAKSDKTYSLSVWAGTSSSDNAFTLNKGYSNAVTYEEDDLYMEKNVNGSSTDGGKLKFKLGESTDINKYVSIDANSGEIKLADDLDISQYYIPIDVYVTNNVDGETKISTVQLAFRAAEFAAIEKNSDILIVENENATQADVLDLFKVKDKNGNYWYGKDILNFDDANITINDLSVKLDRFNIGDSVTITDGTTELSNYTIVTSRYDGNCLKYTTDVQTFNYQSDSTNDLSSIITHIAQNYIGFTNRAGKVYQISDEFSKSEDTYKSGDYTCEVTKAESTKTSTLYTLTFKYKETTLGTISLTVWGTEISTITESSESGDETLMLLPSSTNAISSVTTASENCTFTYENGKLTVTFNKTEETSVSATFTLTYNILALSSEFKTIMIDKKIVITIMYQRSTSTT